MNRQITSRIENLVVGTIALVILLAILAHTQHQDEADDQAARVHVEQQGKAGK